MPDTKPARLGSWLLNVGYLLFLLLVSPILIYRSVRFGKYRAGFRAKWLGDLPPRTSTAPAVWLHAVSVGEVLQLEPVIEQLKARRPDVEIVISTTTVTGHDVALKKYPQHQVIWYPLDFSWAVEKALDRIRPAAIVLVELELWPNFLRAAFARDIPVALINGRISEKSFKGYRWLRPLLGPLLRSFSVIAVQNETYGSRLKDLMTRHAGSLSARSNASTTTITAPVVTGSIKFDRVKIDRLNPLTQDLRSAFGIRPGERVFIAGSTQDPEERYAVQTWLALREKHPGLRLMLVPRHKERFEAVARMVETELRLPLIRRTSAGEQARAKSQAVLLLDTLGELSAAWGLADVAFVGGSLTRRGGQNMLEPAGYGAAVLFGPNTHNFRDIVALLLDQSVAQVIHSPTELTQTVDFLLSHPASAEALGQRARNLVQSHRGATARTVDLLLPLLPDGDSEQSPIAA